ncbi:uncharacterized protein LOC130854873 [Hippopotamus amphibius kiboko]|uniref:uncharacterized protein LOC130854873 n=1 Tax=Hippopotamus amphibius kiboko TaxID=575201 RepID=UPI002593125B|nr:uncharacterized protein LOC130854873 [Hippopotamus amphibius kiboko]
MAPPGASLPPPGTESHWGRREPSLAGASPAPPRPAPPRLPRAPAPEQEVAPGLRLAAGVSASRTPPALPSRCAALPVHALLFLPPPPPMHVNLRAQRPTGCETRPEPRCAPVVPRVPERVVGAPESPLSSRALPTPRGRALPLTVAPGDSRYCHDRMMVVTTSSSSSSLPKLLGSKSVPPRHSAKLL